MTLPSIKKRIVEVIHSNFEIKNFNPEAPLSESIYNEKGIACLRELLSIVFSTEDHKIQLSQYDVNGEMNLDYLAKAIEIKLQ